MFFNALFLLAKALKQDEDEQNVSPKWLANFVFDKSLLWFQLLDEILQICAVTMCYGVTGKTHIISLGRH
jgi:hypothetical protein